MLATVAATAMTNANARTTTPPVRNQPQKTRAPLKRKHEAGRQRACGFTQQS
jgi:hypothetical protein